MARASINYCPYCGKKILKSNKYETNFCRYCGRALKREQKSSQDKVQCTVCHKYIINSVIDKVLYKDLPQVYPIRDINILTQLLSFAAANTANLFEILSLSKNLKVNRTTVSNYLTFLKNALLINSSDNFSRSQIKTARTNKKIYIADSGIANAILGYDENLLLDSTALGHTIETIAFNNCKQITKKVFFWRNTQKQEVDVILELPNKILPIEIKYRDNISSKDVDGLIKFMKTFDVDHGIMLTKNHFNLTENISFLPIWYFLAG